MLIPGLVGERVFFPLFFKAKGKHKYPSQFSTVVFW